MRLRLRVVLASLASAPLFAACTSCDERAARPGAAASPDASAVAAPPPGPSPDAIRSLASVAAACEWPDFMANDARGYASKCADLGTWFTVTHAPAIRVDATLVELLEDADVRVRKVAVLGLDGATAYRSDAALASRVLGAAERDRAIETGASAMIFGAVVGRIHVAATGLVRRFDDWARALPRDSMKRNSALLAIVRDDADEDDAAALVLGYATNAPEPLHGSALAALRSIPSRYEHRRAEACDRLRAGASAPDEYAARVSLSGLASMCKDFDAVLAAIEKRPGGWQRESVVDALHEIDTSRDASPEQKRRAYAIVVRIAKDPHADIHARRDAIEMIGWHNDEAALRALENDPDPTVRDYASRALAELH